MLSNITGALKKFGLTPQLAQSVADGVAEEMSAIGSDLVGQTIGREISNLVRPSLLRMRNDLLASIAGDPPAGFILRMRARGNNITDEQAVLLWGDVIASIAELPSASAVA